MMSHISFRKVVLTLVMCGFAGCGQNPAVKVNSNVPGNSAVSETDKNALAAKNTTSTPEAKARIASSMADVGPNSYFSDSDAQAFSDKDQSEVGEDFPYLNKDQGEMASR